MKHIFISFLRAHYLTGTRNDKVNRIHSRYHTIFERSKQKYIKSNECLKLYFNVGIYQFHTNERLLQLYKKEMNSV